MMRVCIPRGPDISTIVHRVYYFVWKTIQNNLMNIPVHIFEDNFSSLNQYVSNIIIISNYKL